MTDSPQLPQSNALAEAQVDSIAEIMGKDPEGFARQDRDRIVAALRQQRIKWLASEGAAKPRAPKALATLSTSAKAEDLGL